MINPALEALAASSVAVWDYDVTNDRVWLSPEWFRILGHEGASGHTALPQLLSLVLPEDRAAVTLCLSETLEGKRDEYRVEYRVQCRDRVAWVRSVGRIVSRDAEGKPARLAGTKVEITAAKEAEAALALKEEQLRLVIDAAPALIAYVDTELRIRFHNKAYETMFGLSPEQIDGQHAGDIIGGRAFEQTEEFARRALAGEEVQFERTQRDARGRTLQLAARFVPHRVRGRVAGFVGMLVDITERKAAEAKIAELALSDPLTGLPNRRLLFERLSQCIALARRRETGLALLYLDLDGFKPINDGLGHDAGDAVLKEIAGRLRSLTRASDTVARVGGDEFVAVLVDTASRQAIERKAAELLRTIHAPISLPCGPVQVGATIGIASCPEDGDTPEALTRAADSAMYSAKRRGGMQFCWSGRVT